MKIWLTLEIDERDESELDKIYKTIIPKLQKVLRDLGFEYKFKITNMKRNYSKDFKRVSEIIKEE